MTSHRFDVNMSVHFTIEKLYTFIIILTMMLE